MTTLRMLVLLGLVTLTSGCGLLTLVAEDDAVAGPPAAGMCLEGVPDCVDTVVDDLPNQGEAQRVEPRDGLENLRSVGWEQVTIDVDDPSTVTLSWWSGVEPCYALSEVVVDYTDDAVTLTIIEGNEPSDDGPMCIEIAVYKATTITLDEQIGPRSILDGA